MEEDILDFNEEEVFRKLQEKQTKEARIRFFETYQHVPIENHIWEEENDGELV